MTFYRKTGRQNIGHQRISHAGFSFASKLEAALYDLLFIRQGAGEISDIRTQECVYLTDARILYKPDFSYVENGAKIFAEAKGFETSDWRIKRRLWVHYGPGKLYIYKGRAPRLLLDEVLDPSTKHSTSLKDNVL